MGAFQAAVANNIHTITFPANVDVAEAEQFRNELKSWLLLQVDAHVLDLKSTEMISRNLFQPMVFFKQNLKLNKKQLFSIHLKPALKRYITQEGLEQVFNPVEDLNEVRKKLGGSAKGGGIDVEFVNPFLTATQEALKVQAHTEVNLLKPHLKDPKQTYDIAIAGVISLISEKFTGSITLCFPATVFLKIYENMFSEKHEKINSEIEDAAGELLNIIYGQAKLKLNDMKGYKLQKALPTILTGERLKIRQTSFGPTVILPFQTQAGMFHIEIEFQES